MPQGEDQTPEESWFSSWTSSTPSKAGICVAWTRVAESWSAPPIGDHNREFPIPSSLVRKLRFSVTCQQRPRSSVPVEVAPSLKRAANHYLTGNPSVLILGCKDIARFLHNRQHFPRSRGIGCLPSCKKISGSIASKTRRSVRFGSIGEILHWMLLLLEHSALETSNSPSTPWS